MDSETGEAEEGRDWEEEGGEGGNQCPRIIRGAMGIDVLCDDKEGDTEPVYASYPKEDLNESMTYPCSLRDEEGQSKEDPQRPEARNSLSGNSSCSETALPPAPLPSQQCSGVEGRGESAPTERRRCAQLLRATGMCGSCYYCHHPALGQRCLAASSPYQAHLPSASGKKTLKAGSRPTQQLHHSALCSVP